MDPVLLALATTVGQALVNAMATDAWSGVRNRVARWIGGADEARVADNARDLDEAQQSVSAGRLSGAEVAARWQGRVEALIADRPELADQLRTLADDLQEAVQAASPTAESLRINISGGSNALSTGSGTSIHTINALGPLGRGQV